MAIEQKRALTAESSRAWSTVSGRKFATEAEANQVLQGIQADRGTELVEWRVHNTGSGWVIQYR